MVLATASEIPSTACTASAAPPRDGLGAAEAVQDGAFRDGALQRSLRWGYSALLAGLAFRRP